MRRPEKPRFALVLWPTGALGCIPLEDEAADVAKGAVVIAREFDWQYTYEPYFGNEPRLRLEEDGA